MYKELKELAKYKIKAIDGEIGSISDFYFDDDLWTIRYIVVNTGNWLLKNLVLISPVSVDGINDEERVIVLNLTKKQVENSPDIDTSKPISRMKEIIFSNYYHNRFYWTGYNTWGMVPVPVDLRDTKEPSPEDKESFKESSLRSMNEVVGYHIETETGELGHVTDIVFNQYNWQVDYFILNTANILPGEDIEFSIRWINDIDWNTRKVFVKISKEIIKLAG